jgi:hypothetical protein
MVLSRIFITAIAALPGRAAVHACAAGHGGEPEIRMEDYGRRRMDE